MNVSERARTKHTVTVSKRENTEKPVPHASGCFVASGTADARKREGPCVRTSGIRSPLTPAQAGVDTLRNNRVSDAVVVRTGGQPIGGPGVTDAGTAGTHTVGTYLRKYVGCRRRNLYVRKCSLPYGIVRHRDIVTV